MVLLTGDYGLQSVHIAPEAFSVASLEFADQIDAWQEAVNGTLEEVSSMLTFHYNPSDFSELSGAQVVAIDGKDPWDAVEANAAIAGSYQAHTTRQNAFFSSYQRNASAWTYIFGQFAQQSLPLSDEVTLTVLKENATDTVDVTVCSPTA